MLFRSPYLHIEVEDEDSLTERFDHTQEVSMIDIAVIRLPRISNFTDFNPFENIKGVSLRYVQSAVELKNPDMIILPGTKNTMLFMYQPIYILRIFMTRTNLIQMGIF